MNILFNSSGIPLLMQSTYIFGETTGTPQNEMKERKIGRASCRERVSVLV